MNNKDKQVKCVTTEARSVKKDMELIRLDTAQLSSLPDREKGNFLDSPSFLT